ncbi:MAG: LuxR C-terminal-related transcriptional regulator [Minicystis sp.]
MPAARAVPPLESLLTRLSPRRREILELVAKGLTNDDIASVLGITPGTVRIHMTSVLADLHVANRTEAAAAYHTWKAGPARVSEVLARPAIAVLPLVALGRTERARLTAAAVTHDLTALFARWCWFPVIAGASASGGRALGGTPREIGRSLGARFLLDGTLRTGRSSWRLDVRIDDAADGRCRWAERYEFPDDELFEVQDAVCAAIVSTAYEVIIEGLAARVSTPRHPECLDAWALAHEGMLLHAARASGANARARERLAAAAARDPDLALSHFGLGLCHYDEILNQWGDAGAPVERLLACARRCIALAPHAAEGYFLLGRYEQARGRHAHAVQPLEMAVARNPSFAGAHVLLAQLLVLAGRPDEGLTRLAHARRLAPRAYVAGLAAFHFLREEHAEALDHAERAISTNPSYTFGIAISAASAWWLGDLDRARRHARALRRLQPEFSPARFLATFGPGFAGVDRIAKALDSLGLGR